jgi:hypothetical protein
MPVLDVWGIGAETRKSLAATYDALSKKPLLPFAEIETDKTRIAIDAAIQAELGLPDLGVLREFLAREPLLRLSMDRLLPNSATT